MRHEPRPRSRQRRAVRSAPVCEAVEPRLLLSIYIVTNTNDSGPGSLRAGMDFADENAGATPTVIDFKIPGDSVHTITPLSPLPTVGNVLIDGYSQPGAQPNTLGAGDNAVLKIELDGSAAGGNGPGLHLTNGAEVRGLVINRFVGQPAILANPTPDTFGSQFKALVTVDGNFIGTNAAGNAGFAQNNATGIEARGDCLIGGAAGVDGINMISGNAGDGVVLTGGAANTPGNLVQGNYIGTDPSGSSAVPNGQSGIHCSAGYLSVVKNNLISGNTGAGITIDGAFNDISNNRIGVGVADGATFAPLPNGRNGVTIFGAANTLEQNTIAFNHGSGIVDLSGVPVNAGEANSFSANSIYGNTALGIDLGGDGVTPNTPGGPRNSANHLVNYPVLTYAASGVGGTLISGTLNDLPWIGGATEMRVEFFLNPRADPSGYGQGQTFLGYLLVPVDADGNASFTFTLYYPVPVGQFISATASVVGLPSPGQNLAPVLFGTSEFSADVKVGLMGDVNGDGRVDFEDLLILARNYGKAGTPNQGDLDDDGKIDFDDLVLLTRNYGKSTSGDQQIANAEPLVPADAQASTPSDPRRLNRRVHLFAR